MNISGTLIIYVGIFTGSNIGPKNKKDYTSIFKLDIIIIGDIKEKWDDNPSDSDNNKNYKKN